MDGKEGQVFFSRITQKWEPIRFYSALLKKLKNLAQAIDRCSRHSRELVWSQLFYLYNQPPRKCSDLFMPAIDAWCQNQSIDLFAIEAMYYSFVHSMSQYPNLFDDPSNSSFSSLPFPLPSPLSSLNSSPSENLPSFSPSSASLFAMGASSPSSSLPITKVKDTGNPAIKTKGIALSNTSLIWGSDFSAAIQQFALLLNWAPLLEKLPPNQKEAIWNTCQFFPLFSNDIFERTSFRKTFLKWAGNPAAHVDHIVILFASIGFLRDKGIVKHQFFYPNTTQPVFNNGVRRGQTVMQLRSSQSLSLSRENTTPLPSPASVPTTTVPTCLDHASTEGAGDAHIRAVSPHNFFSLIKHEPSTSPSSPVSSPMYSNAFPFASPTRTSSSLFSLPYPTTSTNSNTSFLHNTKSPSSPFTDFGHAATPSTSSSTSNNSSSSSQLGLLALAAIADEQDNGENRQPAYSQNNNHSINNTSSASTAPTSQSNSNFFPIPISSFANTGMLSSSQTVKLHKRKSSCGEYEEETKKPRAMNLSHILCS